MFQQIFKEILSLFNFKEAGSTDSASVVPSGKKLTTDETIASWKGKAIIDIGPEHYVNTMGNELMDFAKDIGEVIDAELLGEECYCLVYDSGKCIIMSGGITNGHMISWGHALYGPRHEFQFLVEMCQRDYTLAYHINYLPSFDLIDFVCELEFNALYYCELHKKKL